MDNYIEPWTKRVDAATHVFMALKIQEQTLLGLLQSAEQGDNFAQQIKLRARWFAAREQRLAMNAQIVDLIKNRTSQANQKQSKLSA
ncbi:hypothetical protein [Pusillimonas sp. ANT_WB101]|uniref:hypothetical protein n=1 Tax=Pusillimonas sp. ANT_WB101 TaxID=2597356 RepID=UPI0011F06875|nr:hypothetical protein [Pusillimonas sp. ANT_WB101]KAA0911164.1 hypothetical protein FQ179_04750 [Pusillimonas sp. ANT_WB101]